MAPIHRSPIYRGPYICSGAASSPHPWKWVLASPPVVVGVDRVRAAVLRGVKGPKSPEGSPEGRLKGKHRASYFLLRDCHRTLVPSMTFCFCSTPHACMCLHPCQQLVPAVQRVQRCQPPLPASPASQQAQTHQNFGGDPRGRGRGQEPSTLEHI